MKREEFIKMLSVYLGTVAISWITALVYFNACSEKIKRDGYIVVKKEGTFIKASHLLKLCMPVYNILNVLVLLYMGDKVYDAVLAKGLASGVIIRNPEVVNTERRKYGRVVGTRRQEPDLSKSMPNNQFVVGQNPFCDYNTMTNAEKLRILEAEREALLNSIPIEYDNGMGNLSKKPRQY